MDHEALILLDMLVAWGADEAIEEAAVSRLTVVPSSAETGTAVATAATAAPVRVAAAARIPTAELAQAAAEAANTPAELRGAIAGFEALALRDTATGPVLFEGPDHPEALLVLPPPSAEEDRAGRLLAGETGAFLEAMLASIGVRQRVLLAPLIPWRPPGDRPPNQAELAICLPFLLRLAVLTRPPLAMLLGPQTVRAVLGPERRTARGRFVTLDLPGSGAQLYCLPTTSPAQLRADPALRPGAWADLRLLRRRMDARLTSK